MSNSTTKLVNPMKVITGKDTRWSYANITIAKKNRGQPHGSNPVGLFLCPRR